MAKAADNVITLRPRTDHDQTSRALVAKTLAAMEIPTDVESLARLDFSPEPNLIEHEQTLSDSLTRNLPGLAVRCRMAVAITLKGKSELKKGFEDQPASSTILAETIDELEWARSYLASVSDCIRAAELRILSILSEQITEGTESH